MTRPRAFVLRAALGAMALVAAAPGCGGSEEPAAAGREAAPAEGLPTPVVEGGGVGCLRIGLPVEAIRRPCRVVSDAVGPGPEGMPERRLLAVVGPDTLEATVVADSIWRIEILDGGPRTADALGVGTPLRRLLAEPGARAIEGEGRLFVILPGHCGLSFQLGATRPAAAGALPVGEVVRRLPPETPVTRVLVFGCREG